MCLYQLKESFRNPRNLRPDRGKVWNKEAPHSVKEMKVRALKLDLPNHLPVVLVRWKGLRRLEVSLGYTHLQEAQKEDLGNHRHVCGSGLGADHLGYCHGASTGLHGVQAQAEQQVLLDSPDVLG